MSQPFNPYAAPSAASADVAIAPGDGQPMPWTPSEVLSAAWKRFGTSWLVLIGAYLVAAILGNLLSWGAQITIAVAHLEKSAVGHLLYGAGLFLSLCASSFFFVGLWRLFLDAARNRPLRFGTLFLGGDRWLPLLGLQLVTLPVLAVGFLFLIVPGVILSLGLGFAQFYVIEANMGPIEAIRASWEVTKGQRGQLFALALLSFLVILAGFAVCCIGALAAGPLAYLAWAIAFTRISGRNPVA
jgi:uncharacterized membrane protein